MKSPLLQKKGMDAFLEALNNPNTFNPDERTDKDWARPEGKGTELESLKTGTNWSLTQDVLDTLPWREKKAPLVQELKPYRTQTNHPTCPECGGGMTRRGLPTGGSDWVCTRCKYSPNKQAWDLSDKTKEQMLWVYSPVLGARITDKTAYHKQFIDNLIKKDKRWAKAVNLRDFQRGFAIVNYRDKVIELICYPIGEGKFTPYEVASLFESKFPDYALQDGARTHDRGYVRLRGPELFASMRHTFLSALRRVLGAKNAPDNGQYDLKHEEHVREEAKGWAQYAEPSDNTEDIKPFDPEGNYLCGTCDMRRGKDQCSRVEGPINFEKGGCVLYHRGNPETDPDMKKKFSKKEVKYSESNQGGFGCHRCEYGGKAKVPDPAGRESWCSFWGMHIIPNACCAEQELVEIKGASKKAAGQELYHVTHTSKVPAIKKQGIKPLQTSNWAKGTGERYGEGEVFAFDNAADAVRWASKMDWEFNKGTGTGKISIVVFDKGDQPWEVDTNDPISQAAAKGKWLKSLAAVKPEQIKRIVPLTTDMTKRLVKGEEIKLAAQISSDVEETPTDRALAKWQTMTPEERLKVMQAVGRRKSIKEGFHACIDYLAKNAAHSEDCDLTQYDKRRRPDYGEKSAMKNPLLQRRATQHKVASEIYVCENPNCKPIPHPSKPGVMMAGRGVEKEFKNWTPVGKQQTPACIACGQPMKLKGKTAADEAVKMHESPRMLPPRDDMRRHLDQDTQKEIMDPVKVEKEGIKVGDAEKTADDPAWERMQELQEEEANDQVDALRNEARDAFMNDKFMQQDAQDAGLSMDELWQEYGNDYANEFWATRQGSKTAVKAEEGRAVCPKCSSSLVEEVVDDEADGGVGTVRLFECKDCSHLFSL